MEVDWANSTAFIFDRDSGEKVKAYVFVVTLHKKRTRFKPDLQGDGQSL